VPPPLLAVALVVAVEVKDGFQLTGAVLVVLVEVKGGIQFTGGAVRWSLRRHGWAVSAVTWSGCVGD